MVLWDGACMVHEQYSVEKIAALMDEHQDAQLIAHPECETPVLLLASHIGSTTALLKYVQSDTSKKYIVATESGIFHQMKKVAPDKIFMEAPSVDSTCGCNNCSYMKLNSLQKLYVCLKHEQPEVTLPADVIEKAKGSYSSNVGNFEIIRDSRSIFQIHRVKFSLRFLYLSCFQIRNLTMIRRNLVCIFLLLLSVNLISHGQVTFSNTKKYDLYLLIGQSNMAGRGEISEEDEIPLDSVYYLNEQLIWMKAADPIHFDKPSAGLGLAKSFGEEIRKNYPDKLIGLIPCAVGGTSISNWQPGVMHQQTISYPWDNMKERLAYALQFGELKGILWHQGEEDSNPTDCYLYEETAH